MRITQAFDSPAPGGSAEGSGFLPDFCAVGAVLGVIVGAELLAILLTLGAATPATLDGFSDGLSLRSLLVQWIALPGALALCLVRSRLNRLSAPLAGLIAWLLVLAIALTALFASGRLAGEVWPQVLEPQFYLRTLVICGVVTALALRYLYLHHLWQQQIRAEAEARFQALQSRIRPHFLFNSMNTIAGLTRSDPELAERTVEDLADLFRASLSDARGYVTLEEELELARGYLRIEARRLGERLRVEWAANDLPPEARVPALIVQPLLENAIYHGIEPAAEPGWVRVEGERVNGLLRVCVRNSLPADGAGARRQGNHMALDNVRQRLAGCFGDRGALKAGPDQGEYRVELEFPLQLKERS